MRKRIILCLAAICLAAMTIGGIACKNDLPFAEFEVDSSAEATYQMVFVLPVFSAVNEDGEEFIAAVNVKDSEGKDVFIADNRFFVYSKEDFTASYTATDGNHSETKEMIIHVKEDAAPIVFLEGPVTYLFRPGEQAYFDLTSDLKTAYYNPAEEEYIVPEFSVTDSAGNAVALEDGQKFPIPDSDEIFYLDLKNGISKTIKVIVRESVTRNGMTVFADFNDPSDMYLFETDFTSYIDRPIDGLPEDKEQNALFKSWTENSNPLKLTFLSDGFGDFSKGAKVSFTHCLGAYEQEAGYKVYYCLPGGERTLLGEYNTHWYNKGFSEFEVPAGGTLVGAYIEVEFSADNSTDFYFDNFCISNLELDQSIGVTDASATEYDLSRFEFVVRDIYGAVVEPETLTYSVTAPDGSAAEITDGIVSLKGEGIYSITVTADGIPVAGTAKLYAQKRVEKAEGTALLTFDTEDDGVLFVTNFTQMWGAPGDGNAEDKARTTMKKIYTDKIDTLTIEFLSDGLLDFSDGGTMRFDHWLGAYEPNAFPYTVYYVSADGARQELGTYTTHFYSTAFSEFTVPEGGTLVGSKIEIKLSSLNDCDFYFDEFIMLRENILSLEEHDVRVVDSTLSEYNIPENFEFVIRDQNGDIVTPSLLTYSVLAPDGTEAGMKDDATLILQGEGIYSITLEADGIPVVGEAKLYAQKRVENAAGTALLTFDTEDDGVLFTTNFSQMWGTPGDGSIDDKTRTTMKKPYTDKIQTINLEFLSDGLLDLSEGGTIRFWHWMGGYENAVVPYTVYYISADGSRQELGTYTTHFYSLASSYFNVSAGSTLVGSKIEIVLSENIDCDFYFDDFFLVGEDNLSLTDTAIRVADVADGEYDIAENFEFDIRETDGTAYEYGSLVYRIVMPSGTVAEMTDGSCVKLSETGIYEIFVTADGRSVNGSAKLLVQERTETEDGVYLLTFDREEESLLFDTNFSQMWGAPGDGTEDDKVRTTMKKVYTDKIATLKIDFLSDGLANTSAGGTLRFDHWMGSYEGNAFPYTIYFVSADGVRSKIGTYTTHFYFVATSEIVLPAGSSLVGASIEFELSSLADCDFYFDSFIFEEGAGYLLSGEKDYVFEPEDRSVNLSSDLQYQVISATGGQQNADDYSFRNAQTGETITDDLYSLQEISHQYIDVYIGDVKVFGSLSISVLPKKSNAAEYAGFDSENDGLLFETNFAKTYSAPADGSESDRARTVLMRQYTEQTKVIRLNFVSDAYLNFSDGGKISFTHCVGAYDSAGISYEVYYTSARGTRQKLGDYASHWYAPASSEFTVEAGGTLVGASIEILLSDGNCNFYFDDFSVSFE